MTNRSRNLVWAGLLALWVAPVRAAELKLVGQWTFDNPRSPLANVVDPKMNVTSVGRPGSAPGKTRQALQLDGTACVVVADREARVLDLDRAFALECWVKLTGPTQNQRLAGKWDKSYYTASYCLWANYQGQFEFTIAQVGQPLRLIAPGAVQSNQWYHLRVTWDGADVLELFVDENSAARQTGVTHLETPPLDFVIGAGPQGIGQVNGLIDEVSFSKAPAR